MFMCVCYLCLLLRACYCLLVTSLAVELGYTGGGMRLAMSLPGALLIILGQKTVFADRKRGDYWMETQEVNPNPIVYSYGEPLFMAGWILMSVSASLTRVFLIRH